VLSIGMLGIAALYLDTLRASRSALYRTQAVSLAADMADRIRTNRNPANAYDCGGACDGTEGGNAVAIADMTAWVDAVEDQLPDGAAQITFAAAAANAPSIYIVAVSWSEIGYDDPLSFELRVEI
jgi:type IV pilus assembly protein PilV